MTLNLISLSQVKTYLGITATTNDAALTALIPIVSSDVRRILNTNFDRVIASSFTSGSDQAIIDDDNVKLGHVLDAPYLTFGTYLVSKDYLTGRYTLSAVAIGSGNYAHESVTISQWPTIAKMIWYKFSKQNTASAGAESLSSITYGPVSKTYSQKEINKQYDYPQTLIDDLGTPFARTV